jgi:hypothetical protein
MDADGGAIPGAAVKVIATATSAVVADTVTNSQGFYGLPVLSAGTYSIEISLAGFRRTTCDGVVVKDDSETTLSTVLES